MTSVSIFTERGDNVGCQVPISFRCERQRRLFCRATRLILLSTAHVFVGLLKEVSLKMYQSHECLVGNRLEGLSPLFSSSYFSSSSSSLPADALSPSHAHTPRALIIRGGLLIFVTYSGCRWPACSPALIENLQMKPGSGCSDPAEQSTGSEQCRTLEVACFFSVYFFSI